MADINEHTTKLYYALDEQMVALHDKDDFQSRRQGEKIVHDLIKNADLPLIIRCRALCVLGCSNEGDYVHYAEQSVHFAKLGLTATQEDGGDETDGKQILRGCEKVLASAREAKAVADAKAATAASTGNAKVEVEQGDERMESDEESDEEGGEEGEEEDEEEVVQIRDAQYEDEEGLDNEGEGEIGWDPDWDEERKAATQGDTKPKEQTEKIRRVHQGGADNDLGLFRVFDRAADSHVPHGAVFSPKMVEVEEDEEMLLEAEEGEQMLMD